MVVVSVALVVHSGFERESLGGIGSLDARVTIEFEFLPKRRVEVSFLWESVGVYGIIVFGEGRGVQSVG
jgi:hypothetical protein